MRHDLDSVVVTRDAAASRASRETFCRYLAGAREQSGKTLGDIAGITRIPMRSLERLEAGEFEELPADTFVRGFLRSYARCVGLDVDDTIRRYAACGMTPAPVASPLADELLGRAPSDSRSADQRPDDDARRVRRLPSIWPRALTRSDEAEGRINGHAALRERGEGEPDTAAEPRASRASAAPTSVSSRRERSKPTARATQRRRRRRRRQRRMEAAQDVAASVAPATRACTVQPPERETRTEAGTDHPGRSHEPAAPPADAPVASMHGCDAPAHGGPAPAYDDDARVDRDTDGEASSRGAQAMPGDEPTNRAAPGPSQEHPESGPERDDAHVDARTDASPGPATRTLPVPVLRIDDDDPEDAERLREERAALRERDDATWRNFLPPALLDSEEGSRRGALTLAVIILVIVATLTMSYLMRRPSDAGDGVTQRLHAPHAHPVSEDACHLARPVVRPG